MEEEFGTVKITLADLLREVEELRDTDNSVLKFKLFYILMMLIELVFEGETIDAGE